MEETQAVQYGDEDIGEDFYETIEAPKFVDLTVSDPFRPDDRYWFCSRVGCDQKHPEEMDSEAIYKNFVMRVMAARSPNVRLHKARRNMKCPLTAPPKSSKSRVPRLALISSISKRIVDARVKSRMPSPKPTATPNVKPKQAHAKAMTTPRNRKFISNTFLSVRNPKTALAEVPKTTVVAKALVFQSPKKNAKIKTSTEMHTPVKSLCAAMKKLEISSVKKNTLGGGKLLPLDVSRKKFRGREVKSRVFDSLGTISCKRQDAKAMRVLKRKSKEKNLKPLHENVDEASDMDIDEKSRHVSMEGCSLSSSDKSNTDIMSKSSRSDGTSIPGSEKRNSEENEFKLEVPCGVEDEKNQECNYEERMKPGATEINISELMESDEKESIVTVYKDNAVASNDIGNENEITLNYEIENVAGGTEGEKYQECNYEERLKAEATEINISELMESGGKESVVAVNKENAVASNDIENENEIMVNHENENVVPNDNREDNSYNLSQGVTFGNENSIKAEKVKGVLKKTLKENSTPVAVGSHGLKSSRPKSTNPKPFRLRTDERGVLREANLEKKLNCPLRDITTSRRLYEDKLQTTSQYRSQKSEKCLNDHECENRAEENNEQKIDSKGPDEGKGRKVPASFNSKKEDAGSRLSKMDSQKCIALKNQRRNLITCQLEPGKEKASRKTEDKLKRTKFEKIQLRVRKPRRDVSSEKEITSIIPPRQLSARKETSLKILSYKDDTKPLKSQYRVRRPATVPKEPNLDSSHLPKSCSRILA